MTASHTKTLLLALIAASITAATVQCQRLTANLDSYQQRYSDCMNYRESWLPRTYAHDFTSQPYQDMAAECDRRASDGGPLW
jgi:hypothetical protein